MADMTSKERVLTALKHQQTDRVPISLGFGVNAPVLRQIQHHKNLATYAEAEQYMKSFSDVLWVSPEYKGPSNRCYRAPDGLHYDIWGVGRKAVSYGDGSYDEISYYPLRDITDIGDLDRYVWPSADWSSVDDFKAQIRQADQGRNRAIILGNGNIFESAWYMRGFEQMFIDLVEQPDLAWEIMRRVTDYFVAYFTKVLQAADGLIDIVFTADDLGGQQGLLMSLDMWERLIKPHHVRMNQVLHEFGVKIMYHTDGAIMQAVPGLIDMGIDILEALQFDAAGMDPILLKESYGDRLCFHGGVSVQKTLPFGTVEDVRHEVMERIRVLGRNGGYILAPSHAVQAGTPPENAIALFETALRHGQEQ